MRPKKRPALIISAQKQEALRTGERGRLQLAKVDSSGYRPAILITAVPDLLVTAGFELLPLPLPQGPAQHIVNFDFDGRTPDDIKTDGGLGVEWIGITSVEGELRRPLFCRRGDLGLPRFLTEVGHPVNRSLDHGIDFSSIDRAPVIIPCRQGRGGKILNRGGIAQEDIPAQG